MKKLLLTSLLSLLSIASLNAQQVEYNECVFNGKTYHNVKIVKTSPSWVSIHHSAGVKSCVPIDTLPNELKRVFSYNRNDAVAWHGAYLNAHYKEAAAAQERAREREHFERIRDKEDREHRRKLEVARAKRNSNWKSDMYNSRPICKTPTSRIRITNNIFIIREWESNKSTKTITARVIDKHLDKNVWKCHLLLKDTKKGYWVNIEDLLDADKEYLSKWIVHEDRIKVEVKNSFTVYVEKSRESQTLKVQGRIGNETEVFKIPAYDENEETKMQICKFDLQTAKTIRIELYAMDGSLISKWKYE